jgi:hypothetical protein
MAYKLKPHQESFQSVDGPFNGRKFLSGQSYNEVPPEEADKFYKDEDIMESSDLPSGAALGGQGVAGSKDSTARTTQRPNDAIDPTIRDKEA